MIKVATILCPTDFSTDSDEALRYATALAQAFEAKLILLHCSRERSIGVAEAHALNTRTNRLFTASMAPYLRPDALDAFVWKGLVRYEVQNIGKAIVDEAIQQNVDLIVMRSRRRPHAAVLLGSTAETVCENAPCPVLVTHPLQREWVSSSDGKIGLNRVLIAYDFSSASKLVMNYGLSLAQEYQAEVHLMHVLSTDGNNEPEVAWSSSGGGNAYTFTAQQLQQALPPEVHLWCKFVNIVRFGKPYEQILEYARDRKIDLICMGVSRREWSVERMLGSNVDRVLRQAPCPVLVGSKR